MTMTEGATLKIKRAQIFQCLTCHLCQGLLNDATTIAECLHSFCRACISKKLTEESLRNCPVCKIDLGCGPLLDKLKPDRTLQVLRAKIFAIKGKDDKAPGDKDDKAPGDENKNEPSFSLPNKRNEKTESALGPNSRPSSGRSCRYPRKAKAAAVRRIAAGTAASAGSSSSSQLDKTLDAKEYQRDTDVGFMDEEAPPKSSSSARKSRVAARKKERSKPSPKDNVNSTCQPEKLEGDQKKDQQKSELQTNDVMSEAKKSSEPESSHQNAINVVSEKNAEPWKGKAPSWEPLHSLLEAARKAKQAKSSNMKESADIAKPANSDHSEARARVIEIEDNDDGKKKKEEAGDVNEKNPEESDAAKAKKLIRSSQPRKVKFTQDLNLPATPPVTDPSSSTTIERTNPTWFALVASKDKGLDSQLPQIPSRYMRVKDGSLPVSVIKRYLIQKLGLPSDTEVEISLGGQPVLSSLQLHHLIDMWLETQPSSERITTTIGSSAKEFVMVLSYSRKPKSS